MTAQRQREIVIEFEKVQTIRKRAKTTLLRCECCRDLTDAVSLAEAAGLFETERNELFRFVEKNDCHYHVSIDGGIYLCVPSLLDNMHRLNAEKRLLNGGEK